MLRSHVLDNWIQIYLPLNNLVHSSIDNPPLAPLRIHTKRSPVMPGHESEKREAAREAVDILYEISSLLVWRALVELHTFANISCQRIQI